MNAVALIWEKLLQMISDNDDLIEKSLNNCRLTLEMFNRLKPPELEEFIFAHDPTVLMKSQLQKFKGTLVAALEAVKNNVLILNNCIYNTYQ